jgi:putative membrane protein
VYLDLKDDKAVLSGVIWKGVATRLETRPEEGLEQQFRDLYGYLPSAESDLQFWLTMGVAAVVGLLLVRLLGVGWFILRFFGYRLTRSGSDFKISCGLFTKVSATVPIRRIQLISVHRSWTMRLLGLASIRIETAGGSASGQEDATKTVSKRWFIPVLPETRVNELMGIIRPELDWDEKAFDWKPLSHRAASRMLRIGILVSLFLVLVGLAASRPWGWLPGVALAPIIIWYELKRSRSTRYVRIGEGVVFRSGVLTRKTSVTFFEKIQAASFSQSPFDRRWGMGTFAIDTAASGPANHTIAIPYLDEDFAKSEYDAVLRLASAS